jgi:hypothetical protein
MIREAWNRGVKVRQGDQGYVLKGSHLQHSIGVKGHWNHSKQVVEFIVQIFYIQMGIESVLTMHSPVLPSRFALQIILCTSLIDFHSHTFENRSSLVVNPVAGFACVFVADVIGAALLHPPKSSSALTLGGALLAGKNPPPPPGTML